MATVSINLYNLFVEVEDEANYHDQITDLSSRALYLFQEALKTAKELNIDICEMELEDLGDDD